MITVTPCACAALAEILEEHSVQRHIVVRVVADSHAKLELSLEAPQLEDSVFSFRGRNVLAVESSAARLLEGTSLDF